MFDDDAAAGDMYDMGGEGGKVRHFCFSSYLQSVTLKQIKAPVNEVAAVPHFANNDDDDAAAGDLYDMGGEGGKVGIFLTILFYST